MTTTVSPVTTAPAAEKRTRRAPLSPRARILLTTAAVLLAVVGFLFLFIRGAFWFALDARLSMLAAMVIAAFTQGVGTVVFHTVTGNRILTPSIMGLDSMYTLSQTLMVFVFGGAAVAQQEGIGKVLAQTALMVVFATILYRWLFSGRNGSLYILLLVGVVFGLAFDSIAVFVQRMLNPTDYDLLSARLFGRMGDVNVSHLPVAFAVCAVVGVILWQRRYRLDVLLLGRDSAQSLGVDHKRELTLMLVLVAVMVAFSTALVGPMTFFGFVVATLAYQVTGSHQHRHVMPMAFLLGLLTLVVGQFIMQHVFYAAGFLTVIIEFLGGILFLVLLLRKGRV
ncbi:iron chelate uptake ABC transporter family permease subunit [Arthrobacter woluwensis]|uniref:iron chelate uptake ABC transporter family permease subunit n=1 Tax=Arthrobacter woluwensis TaxID=156980 RepID=UPI0011A7094A|nr:iron chelate uptake ABC transporter family permease subunit [Arthrobacter woluwensis]